MSKIKAHWKQKIAQPKTYAARMNALRDATEQELIQYGMAISARILAVSINHKKHVANDGLIEIIAYANYLYKTEFQKDAENAMEQVLATLDKIMGADWEIRADALCEKMCEEWRTQHG